MGQAKQQDNKYTMDQLVKAFQAAGLDPVSHYMGYGAAEGLTPEPVGSGTPGSTYLLTEKDDTLLGTTGDDYFKAPEGTLADNDCIDGGAGNHTGAGNDVVYANQYAECRQEFGTAGCGQTTHEPTP